MNRRISLLSVVALSIVSAAAHADLPSGVKVPGIVAGSPPAPLPRLPACADPAITNIVVRSISRQPSGAYNFSLYASVRNAGTADYRTAPGQQTVRVYQRPAGSAAPRLMRSHDFANLRAGEQQEVRLSVLGWWVSQEFPPAYEFVIEYDPDIAVDGNRANDDCRAANNRRTISGDEINAQLRASGR